MLAGLVFKAVCTEIRATQDKTTTEAGPRPYRVRADHGVWFDSAGGCCKPSWELEASKGEPSSELAIMGAINETRIACPAEVQACFWSSPGRPASAHLPSRATGRAGERAEAGSAALLATWLSEVRVRRSVPWDSEPGSRGACWCLFLRLFMVSLELVFQIISRNQSPPTGQAMPQHRSTSI